MSFIATAGRRSTAAAVVRCSPATLPRPAGSYIFNKRTQSTFASTSYENIIVDVVGANKDVSLVTLNRPKAVRTGWPDERARLCVQLT